MCGVWFDVVLTDRVMFAFSYGIAVGTHCFLYMFCCAVNQTGCMAIHRAAEFGSLGVMEYLIREAGVDKNVRGQVS